MSVRSFDPVDRVSSCCPLGSLAMLMTLFEYLTVTLRFCSATVAILMTLGGEPSRIVGLLDNYSKSALVRILIPMNFLSLKTSQTYKNNLLYFPIPRPQLSSNLNTRYTCARHHNSLCRFYPLAIFMHLVPRLFS